MSMTLASLLQALEGRVKIIDRRGDLDVPVGAITDDSRAVSPHSLFVAVKGERVDGHDFIPAAVR
jgi:UDP-N-acetylmuramoyl-L-alanyl-D-glutamate--2,6-diaminopimelate ligase